MNFTCHLICSDISGFYSALWILNKMTADESEVADVESYE